MNTTQLLLNKFLPGIFSDVISSDQCRKPNIPIRLKEMTDSKVYVGDSIYDIEIAKKVHADFFNINDEFQRKELFMKLQQERKVDELLNYIKVFIQNKVISTLSVTSNNSPLIYELESLAIKFKISIAYIDEKQDIKNVENEVCSDARISDKEGKYKLEFLNYDREKTYNNLLYFLTSGSTGKPKLVVRDRNKVLEEAKALYLALPPIDKIISNVLSTHYYGFIYNIALPFICNIKVEVKIPMYPITRALNKIDERTALVTTPWHEYLINEYSTLKSNFIIISSGAEPYCGATQNLREHGITVINQFGSTELGVIFLQISTSSKTFINYLKGVKVNCLDTKTIIDTPYTAECYLKKKKKIPISHEITDVFKKEKNNLEYLGRNDSVININGLKINPEVIELKLNTVRFIAQSLVEKKVMTYK